MRNKTEIIETQTEKKEAVLRELRQVKTCIHGLNGLLVTIFSALELALVHQELFRPILNDYINDSEYLGMDKLDHLWSIISEAKDLMKRDIVW